MKFPACLVVVVAACLGRCSDTSGPKAIYLVQGQGVLSAADLTAHPEVVVVNTFEELWQRTDKPVALWIERNSSTPLPNQGLGLDSAAEGLYPAIRG